MAKRDYSRDTGIGDTALETEGAAIRAREWSAYQAAWPGTEIGGWYWVNLTPHTITLRTRAGGELVIPPSGTVARAEIVEEETGTVAGIPTYRTYAKASATGLPPEWRGSEAVCVLASRATVEAAPWHRNLYFVHHSVRDAEGRIVACEALAQVPEPYC